MIKCIFCGKHFKIISNSHLESVHNCSLSDYIKLFGAKGCGFLSPNLLHKNDPRYLKWRESLKKRPAPWCKGFTKETHPSVLRISDTFKNKKIDNFFDWREKMKKLGKIRAEYPILQKNGDLAELIGVVLGDGHIAKFPRVESLAIYSNSKNKGFIKRYSKLMGKVFSARPSINKHGKNCIMIRVYQKRISERLGVSSGSRKKARLSIPAWVFDDREHLRRYLRGLYEAEGSFCVHQPTYTYKLLFSNKNKSLLKIVYKSLKLLGFSPNVSGPKVQVSKKEEVFKLRDLIEFRKY